MTYVVMKVSGARIRELRLSRSLNQQQLAALLHLHGLGANQATISKWESGFQAPRAYALPAIAQVLGVTVDELFHEDGST